VAARDGHPIDWHRVRVVAGTTNYVTVVGAALAMTRRAGVDAPTGLFRFRRGAGGVRPCVSCAR
jgi:hypothetical protein